MKINNQHILSRVNFELNTASESFAFEKRQTIDSFLKDDLLPDIEILFDELASPEEIKRFESIDIEVDVSREMDFGDLKSLLVSQLRGKIEVAQTDFFESIENEVSSFDRTNPREKQNINSGFEPDKKLEVPYPESTQAGQSQNRQNIFLYFLETGQLPWYATGSLLAEFVDPEIFQTAIQDKIFLKRLINQFSTDKNSLQRFLMQMENELIRKFIFQLANEKRLEKALNLQVISKFSQVVQNKIYELIISSLIHTGYVIRKEVYQQLQNELFADQKLISIAEKQTNQIQEILGIVNPGFMKLVEDLVVDQVFTNGKKPDESEVFQRLMDESDIRDIEKSKEQRSEKSVGLKFYYVQNAGLILAHPFIQNLFTQTNCLVEKMILHEKKSLAVHLLHYLATGEEQEFECKLGFEKYLCGIAPEFMVDRKIKLTDQEKTECNDLLKSMIGHWTALKNSSPDTLRQMFLQRNGKLDLEQSPHKLYLERMAQDILLEKLPWNISVVKLPWMEDLLFIEWQ
ncbi:MAG TPA: hypothetical protein DHV48_09070 [Prolixibacteraceae bacterium]|nr:hypothetical protein [Prolixibacteraceae bacterium]